MANRLMGGISASYADRANRVIFPPKSGQRQLCTISTGNAFGLAVPHAANPRGAGKTGALPRII